MAYILQTQMLNACDWNIRRSNANKAKQNYTRKFSTLKYVAKNVTTEGLQLCQDLHFLYCKLILLLWEERTPFKHARKSKPKSERSPKITKKEAHAQQTLNQVASNN